jgi:ParB family chromosome partitioning protein
MNELLHLNPAQLTTDKNVRKDLDLTREFLASVKNSGVLEPIVAYPDPITDGAYRIHLGHRRAAAAVEGGLDTVPVYVISEREAADRIAEQLVENVHRSALKPAETAEAYQALSLFGLPATAIAKKTSTKLAAVGNALKVANNETATKVLQDRQLTIDEALVFTEFDNDEKAIAELTAAASNGRLTHTAQVLRNERIEAKNRAAALAEAEATGYAVLDAAPSYEDARYRSIKRVFTDEARTTPLTLAEAEKHPDDIRVYLEKEYTPYGQPDTYVHTFAVTNWAAHGWHATDYGTKPKGPLTDDEKAERRVSRENAKLWTAATAVRIQWVKDFLKRRSLPNDYSALAALWFARTPTDYQNRTRDLAHTLLELDLVEEKAAYSTRHVSALPGFIITAPTQGAHVLVALAVAGFETSLDPKQGWASNDPTVPLYLQQLSGWGYPLSELEENLVNGAAKDEDAA